MQPQKWDCFVENEKTTLVRRLQPPPINMQNPENTTFLGLLRLISHWNRL